MVQKLSRPRGRPPAYDAELALRRALDRFWIAGYAATSLDELSAATGMKRPSLYGAFGDKRELYLKALESYRAANQEELRKTLAHDRPLREALGSVYEKALSLYLSGDPARGCFSISTAVTEALTDPAVRAHLADSTRELDAAFEARIRDAREKGELPSGADPAALAALATATLHTLALRARAGEPRAVLEKIVEGAIDVICGSGSK